MKSLTNDNKTANIDKHFADLRSRVGSESTELWLQTQDPMGLRAGQTYHDYLIIRPKKDAGEDSKIVFIPGRRLKPEYLISAMKSAKITDKFIGNISMEKPGPGEAIDLEKLWRELFKNSLSEEPSKIQFFELARTYLVEDRATMAITDKITEILREEMMERHRARKTAAAAATNE